MKQLIIAEKPSVARDIAAALGGFKKAGANGAEWLERDDAIVSSAVGHLVELACPEGEDPGYDLSRLPVIPGRFGLAPVDKTKSQLILLKRLMAREDVHTVVNACDAGREGELIFRYIYLFCGCRKAMKRMWLQSMTQGSIREAYSRMRPGAELDPLFASAQSRSEADWLVGINGTRAVSILQGLITGERSKNTVGRVQTPTLFLIVEREETIQNFVSKPFWEVHATFRVAAGEYVGKWHPAGFTPTGASEAKPDRVFEKARAEAVVAKCSGRPPSSVTETSKEQTSAPPRLFDLTSLQREANKRFGLSAKATLDVAQALYEKHKVLSYPRTDSSALPEDYVETAKATLAKLAESKLAVAPFANQAIAMVKPDKRVFNNAKISDHFAIVPTGRLADLAGDEAKIFDLVVRRFVATFHPDAKFLQTDRISVIEGESFRSSGRVLLQEGWLAVYGREVEEKEEPGLCRVSKGETPSNAGIKLVQSKTAPPPRFTEATLLSAMESAGASIEDDALREAMKDRGLGTPATRAATIEKLLGVGYVERQKKVLVPTRKAFELINFLRDNDLMSLTSPATTGEWEFRLRQMEQGKVSRRDFMAEIADVARDIVLRVRSKAPSRPASHVGGPGRSESSPMQSACPKCKNKSLMADARTFSCPCGFKLWRRICEHDISVSEGETLLTEGMLSPTEFKSKAGKPFKAGLRLAEDFSGKVEFVFEQQEVPERNPGLNSPVTCPQCGNPMRRIVRGQSGAFWGCTQYPSCKKTMQDRDGNPITPS